MEYNKIIAVTGLPGLYELLSSKSDGAIVRSLDDKTTRFVSSRIHNFSHLESIEVYTVRDNVNLVEILKAMEVSKDKLPDDRDATALKTYFAKVYPDLDFTRVYSSDLKKMVKWFVVLKANDIEIKLTEPGEDGQEASDDTDDATSETPNRKAGASKAAVASRPAASEKVKAEAPQKKAAVAPEKTVPAAPEKSATGKAAEKKAAMEPTKSGKKAAAGSTGKAAASKSEKEKKASSKKADKPKKAAKKK